MKLVYHSFYDSFPREYGETPGEVHMYADQFVMKCRPEPNSVALLVEPRSIIPDTYRWVEQNWEKYIHVYTFDGQLLEAIPNSKLMLYGQITAEFPDGPKTKNISMACSGKEFCEGHKNRQRIARELKGRIDVFGTFDGGAYASDEEIYSGYRFTVAMENYKEGYYFTEKICNCFASKIVPIYWGTNRISKFFDTDGIIKAATPDDVPKLVDMVLQDPEGEYTKRLDAVERNYKYVQDYRSFARLFLKTYGEDLERIAEINERHRND